MAIASAIQKGSSVYVYDEKGSLLFSRSAGSGAHDGLQGYTGTTVSIRVGSSVSTYNEKGSQLFSRSA